MFISQAANEAYLKDIQQGNMRDLTLDKMIRDKLSKPDYVPLKVFEIHSF